MEKKHNFASLGTGTDDTLLIPEFISMYLKRLNIELGYYSQNDQLASLLNQWANESDETRYIYINQICEISDAKQKAGCVELLTLPHEDSVFKAEYHRLKAMFGEADEDFEELASSAQTPASKLSKSTWLKFTAIAALLCLLTNFIVLQYAWSAGWNARGESDSRAEREAEAKKVAEYKAFLVQAIEIHEPAIKKFCKQFYPLAEKALKDVRKETVDLNPVVNTPEEVTSMALLHLYADFDQYRLLTIDEYKKKTKDLNLVIGLEETPVAYRWFWEPFLRRLALADGSHPYSYQYFAVEGKSDQLAYLEMSLLAATDYKNHLLKDISLMTPYLVEILEEKNCFPASR